MSIELMMPSNHLILCCPLLFLPLIFPGIRVFSNKLDLCIRWPKYWSFSFRSVLPMNIQDWFPLGRTGLIPLQSKGLLRVSSNTTVWKHQFFSAQPSSWSSSPICTWLLEKPKLWLDIPLLARWCLCFLTQSRFVIAFLSMSKCLISWLQSPSTVILKSVTVSCFPPPVCHEHSTFFPALVHTLFSLKPLDKHEAPGHFMGLEKKLCVCMWSTEPKFWLQDQKIIMTSG